MKVKEFCERYTGIYHCFISIRCLDEHIDKYLLSILSYKCKWRELMECDDEILNNQVSSFMFSFDVFYGVSLVIFIEKGVNNDAVNYCAS